MGRISASLSGFELQLLHRLGEANAAAALSSLRAATGERILRPKDDPSGYIAVAGLQAELARVTTALGNVTSASSVVSRAQLTLDQIRTQLNTIRSSALADQDQTLSASARAANQAVIDAAITEINRLVASDAGGRSLLDGSADYRAEGVNAAQVRDLQVHALGPATSQTIDGTVTAAATQAQLVHSEAGATLAASAVFVLSGNRGSATITVTAGESLDTVATRINLESHLTGVTATVNGNDIELESIDFGSRASVAVSVSSGTFATTGTGLGTNAAATINGRSLTGDGNTLSLSDNGFEASIELAAGFVGALDEITLDGQALTFAVSTDPGRVAQLAIPALHAARLGGLSGTLNQLATGGSLSGLNTNAPQAVRVVDEALAQLTLVEGRVDGFADATIDASSSLLSDLEEELVAAIDQINEVDDDEEELLQARYQALADNARAGLTLLALERSSIVELVRDLAGLD